MPGSIEQRLRQHFQPSECIVIDESQAHAGHNPAAAGGGTHINIRIVSSIFYGKTLMERHRMVYHVLKEDMKGKLHAVKIVALTPPEADEQ